MKYAYPAIFTPEEDGGYSVRFPDLEGCFTCGDTMADAIFMAEDALALVLYGYEHDNRTIPVPSPATTISLENNEFINTVACDTLEYRKRFHSKSVKKTLTIPEWLNEAAIVFLADKLIQETQRVTIETRFADSMRKCKSPEACKAHEQQLEQARKLQDMIQSLCHITL